MHSQIPVSAKEKRQHSTVLIPYSVYNCRIPDYFVNVPLHWHSEFEINYILEGTGEFICGDNRCCAAKGDIIIIPPNMLHAAYPLSPSLSYDAFVFNTDMLSSSGTDRSSIECIRPIVNGSSGLKNHLTPADNSWSQIKECIDSIFICCANNDPISDLLIKSELLRIFWLLENSLYIRPSDSRRLSCSETIRPALEFMNSHFSEPITISQLAELVNLSKSYFMSCFQKAAGVGAIEYLSQLRIRSACDMLCRTDLPVSEIAFQCGFSNLSNFNRQFRKIAGCPPHKYRKKEASP